MTMSDDLKKKLAEQVYSHLHDMLQLTAPMKEWSELSHIEQNMCAESMRIWMAGLGTNEVGETWFQRSGDLPRTIWDQLPDIDHQTPFEFAALHLIVRLIDLAEQGLKYRDTMQLIRDLWQVIDDDEDVKILTEDHLGHEWMDDLRERSKEALQGDE